MIKRTEDIGSKAVFQKSKHCDVNSIQNPSRPENVEHIINLVELSPYETRIAKLGVLKGVRKALSKQLDIPQDSISDEQVLQGSLFINEEVTIEHIP